VGLGMHIADLSTEAFPGGGKIKFTFRWPEADRWEGKDFNVNVETKGAND